MNGTTTNTVKIGLIVAIALAILGWQKWQEQRRVERANAYIAAGGSPPAQAVRLLTLRGCLPVHVRALRRVSVFILARAFGDSHLKSHRQLPGRVTRSVVAGLVIQISVHGILRG